MLTPKDFDYAKSCYVCGLERYTNVLIYTASNKSNTYIGNLCSECQIWAGVKPSIYPDDYVYESVSRRMYQQQEEKHTHEDHHNCGDEWDWNDNDLMEDGNDEPDWR